MTVRRTTGFISVATIHWRQLAQRGSFVLLLTLASGILVFGKIQPTAVENFRMHAIDGLAPIIDAFQRPMTFVGNVADRVNSYFSLRQENEKLRSDLAQVREWQNAVVALQNENRELHSLLHFKVEPGLAYISARVIADTGGPFVRTQVH